MKTYEHDVFGQVSMESPTEPILQPTVAMWVPGIDKVPLMGSVVWKGVNLEINPYPTVDSGDVGEVGLEGMQQIIRHELQQKVKNVVAQAEAQKIEKQTHQHAPRFDLWFISADKESILETIEGGHRTGVYLTDPRNAYSADFLEALQERFGNRIYTTMEQAELFVERQLARG